MADRQPSPGPDRRAEESVPDCGAGPLRRLQFVTRELKAAWRARQRRVAARRNRDDERDEEST